MTTSVPKTLQSFDELWSPRLIACVNDHEIRLVKIDGEFVFHAHPDSDELFYVLSGEMTMEIEGKTNIEMEAGDVYTVPKGVRHRPVAQNAQVMIVEKAGTVNTGDAEASERTKKIKDVRNVGAL
ncbi:hypothetical protein QQS21_001196 [Conoideocrella luteorostrata]|uniref:Cupin type-2 domain-containing protein n=1 Tax=Conoideocrella luteorostrata TaxID=1105319 RepID=A0AAJ0CXI1_9HYPO|nr:hypothetical protein QQS21_001196 [Conoideocrella luteorostrata]